MRTITRIAAITVAAGLSTHANAQKNYGPGVTDTEIKIGQTMPYSGPASSLAMFGRVPLAYFKKVNAEGGINGRKVNLISLDDAFSPPKTVEQVRKLVESDEVLAIMGSVGTPTGLATAKYLNAKKVPQLFLTSGSPKLEDPKGLPWTTTFYASQLVEARIYAEYLLKSRPDAKLAVLYQNDDLGKGYLSGIKIGLGAKATTMIVKETGYEITEPTIDSQILTLKASGADTLFIAGTPKFAAQAIRKAHETNWKVQHVLMSGVSQISSTLRPAGLEASTGAVTSIWHKQPGDPDWADDKDMRDYQAFLKEWAPGEQTDDSTSAFAYTIAQMMVEVLKRCGDDLTRENVLKQATNVKGLQLPLMVPGVRVNISPDNRVAWRQGRMARFDGSRWVFFGDIITVSADP
ncbi:ABC transporter substrate-binding protein [Bradyrhizobium sp. AUGA SZCCT0042]|nr:ABC transporter substrate-binding protein [Bradyrhizobium sp. AUGA SZCCT0042]